MVIFLQSKSFVRRRLRRRRLRHEIRAIKTRPNNPLRFLQCKNSIRRYLANDLTCAARKTTFRTRKRFHNKQYTPKSKDQPFESECTHFYVRFNKSNVAMHRPTIIFLLSHKITTVQQKTTNRNNQSNQTITTNNPHNHSIKNNQKTNRQNKHDIQSNKNNTPRFFEYYNIANGNCFRANRKYAFYKNLTQIHKTKQHNLHSEVIIKQPRKSKTLFLDTMKPARKNV